jgi:hypothetical protein
MLTSLSLTHQSSPAVRSQLWVSGTNKIRLWTSFESGDYSDVSYQFSGGRSNKHRVSGTIKRQKDRFVRMESTTNYREGVSKSYAFETPSSFYFYAAVNLFTGIDI